MTSTENHAQIARLHVCPRCRANNPFVNFCRCDPDNLPTKVQESIESIFGPVIYSYTRAQALADGVLIDVSETAREAGITFPVAITAAAWADCVLWTEADSKAKRAGQSERGRLWDVVWMLRFAIRAGRGGELIRYRISRIPRPGCGAKRLVTLKAVCGPGDNAEPCIAIMLPNED